MLSRAFPVGVIVGISLWARAGDAAPQMGARHAGVHGAHRMRVGGVNEGGRVGEMLTVGYAITFRLMLALKSHKETALRRTLLRNPFTRKARSRNSIRFPYKRIGDAGICVDWRLRIPSIGVFDTNGSR
ncbi:hypothetical protein [Paraburkholderia lycopersici]|uniref:hypothetical protein n=1 Tax=Paraburkholderia lycopersici TaxID=416944 RepID=UPI0011613277|nr:hypothetical protein [Paraburkholderia lycopersici]